MPERFTKPDPLNSRLFQQFLKDQNQLVEIDPLNPEDWQQIPSRTVKAQYRDGLWMILRRNAPFLVSGRVLATALRGSATDRDIKTVTDVGDNLKSGIVNPDSLYVRRVGQGFGIKSFALEDSDALEAVYFLWENMGKFVSNKLLAQKLYGAVDDDTIDNINSRYNGLEGRLSFASAVIEQADFEKRQRYYRLRIKNQPEPKKEINPKSWSLKGVYSKEFQDWWVEAGIVERANKIWWSTRDLNYGKRDFSAAQTRVLNRLLKYQKYFVEPELIADSFWGRQKPDNWRSLLGGVLYDIRTKLTDRDAIFVSRGIGWALGVTNFARSELHLPTVNTLWVNEGNFVPEEKLGYDSVPFDGKPAAAVRKALVHGHYLVGSRSVKVPGDGDSDEAERKEFILIHNRDLVRYDPAA